MNTQAFISLRNAHPNPIVEFRWPARKEIPSDVRKLSTDEFYLAVTLAAKCVGNMKNGISFEDDLYKEKYDNLLVQFHTYVMETKHTPPSYDVISSNLNNQISEISAEIDVIKSVLKENKVKEKEGEKEKEKEEVKQEVKGKVKEKEKEPPKKRGRPPKKVPFPTL